MAEHITPEELRRLDAGATPGEWRADHPYRLLETRGAVDDDGIPYSVVGEESNPFIATLVNAYRAGLLIHADEVREVVAMVDGAMNCAFAAGVEEREGGSARRQEKALEKVEACRSAARALLSKLPPNGAKGE